MTPICRHFTHLDTTCCHSTHHNTTHIFFRNSIARTPPYCHSTHHNRMYHHLLSMIQPDITLLNHNTTMLSLLLTMIPNWCHYTHCDTTLLSMYHYDTTLLSLYSLWHHPSVPLPPWHHPAVTLHTMTPSCCHSTHHDTTLLARNSIMTLTQLPFYSPWHHPLLTMRRPCCPSTHHDTTLYSPWDDPVAPLLTMTPPSTHHETTLLPMVQMRIMMLTR
jgi:hypothetical protein